MPPILAILGASVAVGASVPVGNTGPGVVVIIFSTSFVTTTVCGVHATSSDPPLIIALNRQNSRRVIFFGVDLVDIIPPEFMDIVKGSLLELKFIIYTIITTSFRVFDPDLAELLNFDHGN
jgi:hypothetical protein